MPTITTLPQETLLHIIQELSPADISHTGQTCKALHSHMQDRYVWLTKARRRRTRAPNSCHYLPRLATLGTEELKRDAFREVWVDSGWTDDGFKPAYMKSFAQSYAVRNPIILPGGNFVLFSSLSGRISLRQVDYPRMEMALNEVASHQLKSANESFTVRPMHTQDGVILAGIIEEGGQVKAELLQVMTLPPAISAIKVVNVCMSAQATLSATCAQANMFTCLTVTASHRLRVLVTTIRDSGQDHEISLLLFLNQEYRPHGYTICMPSPDTVVLCDGPSIHMYNIPDFEVSPTQKTRHTMEINHAWRWDDSDPQRNIPLSPNIVFWNESRPPTLHLISEYGRHVLTFETIGNSSKLDVKNHDFKALQTAEIGDIELRRFISKGEKGLLCHEDSITPGQILRTVMFDEPNFDIHYVRLYHENFWSSGLEDYWIEELDFDEVSGRMIFLCANPEEEEPFKIFIVDMV